MNVVVPVVNREDEGVRTDVPPQDTGITHAKDGDP